jgi:hypothetical protein
MRRHRHPGKVVGLGAGGALLFWLLPCSAVLAAEARMEQPIQAETGRQLLSIAAPGPALLRVSLEPLGPGSAGRALLTMPALTERPVSQRLANPTPATAIAPARLEQALGLTAPISARLQPLTAACDAACVARTLAETLLEAPAAVETQANILLRLSRAPQNLLLATELARPELLELVALVLLSRPVEPGLVTWRAVTSGQGWYLTGQHAAAPRAFNYQHGVYNKIWINQ